MPEALLFHPIRVVPPLLLRSARARSNSRYETRRCFLWPSCPCLGFPFLSHQYTSGQGQKVVRPDICISLVSSCWRGAEMVAVPHILFVSMNNVSLRGRQVGRIFESQTFADDDVRPGAQVFCSYSRRSLRPQRTRVLVLR